MRTQQQKDLDRLQVLCNEWMEVCKKLDKKKQKSLEKKILQIRKIHKLVKLAKEKNPITPANDKAITLESFKALLDKFERETSELMEGVNSLLVA